MAGGKQLGATGSSSVDLRVRRDPDFPPVDAKQGIHRFPLIATHANDLGGAEIGYCGLTVRLGILNYAWRGVLVALYVLLLAALTLARLAQLRSLGTPVAYFKGGAAKYVAKRVVVVGLALLVFLVIWRLAPGTVPPFTRTVVAAST